MTKLSVLTGMLLLAAFCSFAQTPGLIFKSAGTGAAVLDPNGDGYTSASTAGFTTNDQAQSEIPYRPLVVPAVEPVADPGPGPDCGFTDIVDSGAEDPIFTYFDANGNLLFRFRLGNAASNSKGYSVMIDTDQKFGFTGPNADPNAVSGNPGFEIEIVLRTNFSVSLYDVNGTSSPVLKTDALSYENYAQKSIALTTNCSNTDYFYDFYIPFSVITANFPAVNTSTPLRMVAVTSMNPAPAIGNSAVSDVGGIDDQAYGYNYDNIFQTIIDNFTPTPITGIGTARDRSACPAITSPVANSSTTIFGTSTEIGATIKVYKGITEPLTEIGTATVAAGGSWVATVPAVATGEVISASAANTNEGESYYSCSQVTVTNCSSPIPPYNLVRESNRKYISGNATPGGIIKVYAFTAGSYVLQSGTFTLDATGNGTFCWVPGLNTNTCTPPNGSGSLVNGTTYYLTQTIGGCESAKAAVCVDNQVSVTPILTQTTLYTNTTTISGTSGSGASITIYANGTSIAATTAIGTSWTATVNLSTHAGKYISVGAVEGTKCIAIPLSAAVLVTNVPAVSSTPAITGSYCAANTGTAVTISGTSSESSGTVITLYINGVSAGTATVFNGVWSKVLTVTGNDVVTATATAPGETVSGISAGVTVNTSGFAPAVTFTTPIIEGSTSFSGTFTGSGTLKVYIDGALLGSTTTNSFTISGLTVYDLYAGGTLKATLTSGGCESALSAGATVDCLAPLNSIAVSPSASSVCQGSTSTVTLTASQSGIIYQLYDGVTISGSSRLGTGNDLDLTSGTLSANATLTVKALKISAGTCTVTLTGLQAVTVTPVITGNTVIAPATATFCQSGDPDKITGSIPGGGNGSFAYQWQSSTDNTIYSNIVGATGQDYDPGVVAQTTYFKRIATSATCQSTSATPAVITIENTALTNTITSTVSTSLTDSGVPAMDGTNAGGGVTYVWQSSSDNSTFTNTGITSEDYAPGASVNNTIYFRRIATSGSCSAISNVITYSVNHTPSVSGFTKNGTEDQNINFAIADFTGTYSDSDNDLLVQIRIESISANGTLYSGPTALNAGSVVLLADLANLTFTPVSNYNGSTSFTWKGFDGAVYSASAATVTLTFAAENDAPSATNKSVSVTEDVPYAFTAADFSSTYSDPEANVFAGIRITGLETAGSLKLNGVDVAVNDVVSASDLASSLLTFTPVLNANGNAYATFTFQVSDGTDYSASSYTLTVNVSTVNDPPTADNTTVSVTEDVTYVFSPSDFNASYLDAEGNAFAGIRITSLETAGSLKLNGVDVALNDVVSAANLVSSLLTFAPASNASGNNYATFTFKVSDGTAYSTVDYTVTIDVNSMNDAPTAGNNTIAALEDIEYNFTAANFSASYADAEGNSFDGIRITALPAVGALKINGINVMANAIISAADLNASLFTFTPAADATGIGYTSFMFQVYDGTLYSSSSYTLTVNVDAVNDAPSFTKGADQSHTTNAGAITVSGWATNIATGPANEAGQTLTFTVTNDNNALFSVQPDVDETTGNLTYTIAPATNGVASANVQLSDNGGVLNGGSNTSAVQNFTINVSSGANAPPVASDATVSLDENKASGSAVHTVVATDADGNTLSYSITAGNSTGAFVINGTTGEITVANAASLDYEVTVQFVLTVRVTDGTNSDNATITIDLNNLNDNAPVANDDAVTINENSANGSSVHTVIATDADGNTLTYTITAGNTSGAFGINSTTGAITVADPTRLNYETLNQFVLTVRVSDGTNNDNATITIDLNNLNDNAPVATDATVSIDENSANGTPVHSVAATDADGNSLTYTITSGNTTGAFTINSATGAVTVADVTRLDYETISQFVLMVRASDGTNHDDATITIDLNNLNDNVPVANNATVFIDENLANGMPVHSVVATDADGNTLTYTITAGNTSGAFALNSVTGAITVADATKLDYETLNQFVLTVRVSDGTNNDDATITVDLNNLDDNTPVANDAAVSIDENSANGTLVHTVVATDADGNSLTYAITAGNTTGAFVINGATGAITVADATRLDYETLNQFMLTVNASDGTGNDNATITIDLNNLNDNAPVAADATFSINENLVNGTSVHTVTATDADGNSLTYTITAGNASGAFGINSATGVITVADVTRLDYETLSQFVLTVRASDGTNNDNATITVFLNNLNDNVPVASDATVSINENLANGTSVHTIVATDTDGSTLTYTITAGNTTGAFAINSATGVITVADSTRLDYEIQSQFILTVRVSDGTSNDDATITIDLNNLNDNAPVANDTTVSIDENASNGTVVFALPAADADGSTMTYSISTGNGSAAFAIDPVTGIITVNDSTALDYETTPQFILTVLIHDGLNSTTVSITINLTDLPDLADVNSSLITATPVSVVADGTVSHITVQLKDISGNNLTASGGTIKLFTTTGTLSTVTDNDNGSYEATISSLITVTATITATLDDVLITDNAEVVFTAGAVSATTTTITASVHTIAASGVSTSLITIQAKDVNGNNLVTGGDLVTVSTTGGTISGITDNEDGTYTAILMSANTAGTAVITGTVNGTAIADDETVIFVAGVASASTSTITPASSVITADGVTTTVITIQLKDVNGNNITAGGDDIDLVATQGTLATVVDNGDGTYTVILTSSTNTGVATVTGTLNGVAITDNAVINFNPGPASVATTLITASVSSLTADGTSTSTVTIQAKDAQGNNLTTGGDNITLSTTAGTLTNVIDHADGTYTATLTSSTTAGVAIITGTLNGVSINNTEEVEFTSTVPVLTASTTSNLLTIPADGLSTAVITITVKDQDNNPVNGLTLNASTTAGTLSSVVNDGNGGYTITLTSSTTPGNAEITITVDGISQLQTIIIEFTPVTSLFFIPEGFSPDGDGVNDTFIIQGTDGYKVTLTVYNRWGNVVYESRTYNNDWDGQANQGIVLGQKLPDGTYFYAVDLNNGQKPYVRYFTIKRK
jgi:gliding motility-associated-like protein